MKIMNIGMAYARFPNYDSVVWSWYN